MQRDIFLIGSGQTRFGEWWEKSVHDLIREAVDKALEDTACLPTDIAAIVVANMLGERLNNQAQLGAFASTLLPHRPPALRVEAACASGSVAIHTACSLLESGRARNVLVVGAEKMTDAGTDEVSAALMGAADAEKDAPVGLTFPGIFGLVAKRYMYDHGLSRSELNIVSEVHHQNAVENPFAQFRKPIPAAMIEKSPLVADPLRLLDCSHISDGAAACILSAEKESDLRLAASQIGTDALSLADRPSLTSFVSTKTAAENAFQEAAITREDIDCIELHDCFSIAALVNLEDLGFADPGEGIRLYKDSGDLTINASGGLKACGHPVAATGVKQLVDISKTLRKRGDRWGLTHNLGGVGATCCIHLLEHSNS